MADFDKKRNVENGENNNILSPCQYNIILSIPVNQWKYFLAKAVLLCKQRNKMAASGKKRNVAANVKMCRTMSSGE